MSIFQPLVGEKHATYLETLGLKTVMTLPYNHLRERFTENQTQRIIALQKAMMQILNERPGKEKIERASDTLEYFRPLLLGDVEKFAVMYLRPNMSIISTDVISIGTTDRTLFDVKTVIRTASINNATSVILAHNHPSENIMPSRSDIDLTERARKALEMVNIELIDHIIVTCNSYYSIIER